MEFKEGDVLVQRGVIYVYARNEWIPVVEEEG